MNETLAPDSVPSDNDPESEGLVSEEIAPEAAANKPVARPKASQNLDFAADSRLLTVLRENAREQKETTRLVREVLTLVMAASTLRAKRERSWLILLMAQVILVIIMGIGIWYLVYTKDM